MAKKDPNIIRKGSAYGSWMIEDGLWGIHTGGADMYLLLGTEKALLIDTGYGKGDLPRYLERLTDLPIMVVNTHNHYDHSSGNAFFREVWFGEAGDRDALGVLSRKKLPYPDYQIHHLQDGQIIDIGDREIEVITIGAHHPSSCAFLDHKSRALFVGDEVESCQVLMMVVRDGLSTEERIRKHLSNMKKLKAREAEYDRIFPAHNGSPMDKSYIDDFIGLSESILSGSAVPCESIADYGWGPMVFGGSMLLERYRYKKASFICRKEKKDGDK